MFPLGYAWIDVNIGGDLFYTVKTTEANEHDVTIQRNYD